MKRTLVPNSSRSAATRSSTSASTVASSPVVGSSRMRSVGSEASAMAMTTRCCMPPGELVRIAAHDSGRVGDLHLRAASRGPGRAPRPCRRPASWKTSAICVADADRRVQRARRGSGRPSRASWRAQAAHLRARPCASRSAPSAWIEPADDPPVPRQVAHDRERGRRLAAAGLADEPVRLALARSSSDTPRSTGRSTPRTR